MAKFPTYEQMAKNVAEKALDEYLINGKSLREWVKIITEQEPCEDCISRKSMWKVVSECEEHNAPTWIWREMLAQLPSVHPKIDEDCISREKTIEKFCDYVGAGMSMNDFDALFDIVVKMPSVKPEAKWIPISERLPEAFSFVNCTCHSLVDNRKDWVVETVYLPQPPDSPYSDWGNIPMLNSGDCEVVAWMYRKIPEPYKESVG